MPDFDTAHPLDFMADNTDYPNPAGSATPSSSANTSKILSLIQKNGPISFPDFLNIALYDPDTGYYSKNTPQVGSSGDFYTSVSVGPLLGTLLAHRFINWWNSNNRPTNWRVTEIGAHTGQLAHDILSTLQHLDPLAWESLNYTIIEPLPALRTAQQHFLDSFSSKITISHSAKDLKPAPGIAFGNEIIDALPFHLIKKNNNSWSELHVSENFQFIPQPINADSPLASAIASLPHDLPDDYQTEIRTCLLPFLRDIATTLAPHSLLLFLDYGFAAPEYYNPFRTTGTLRTFSKHKAGENPLILPGELDITAHVDFTALANAASSLGYQSTTFSNQGSYLTHLATPLITNNQLTDPKLITNFQTLTHPAHLGSRFHAIEFSKNSPSPLQVLHRLAYNV